MKNRFLHLSLLVLSFVFFFISGFHYPSGSPGGKTGSPGDSGATCTQCHSGTAIAINNWISSNIPEEGYVEGNSYTLTATGTHTGVSLFGFEVTAEDNAGNKVGTFSITNSTETQFKNNNASVSHTGNGNTPSGSSKSWQFDWTAPTGVDEVTFYGAFNAANGSGSTAGDVIYTSTLNVSKASNTNSAPIFTSNPPTLLANVDEQYMYSLTAEDVDGDVLSLAFTTFPTWMALNDNGDGTGSIDGTPALADIGNHDVVITVSDGVNDAVEQSFTITVQESTTVVENRKESFEIYPNPNNGVFTIKDLNSQSTYMKIYNQAGQAVYKAMIKGKNQEIDVSFLEKGIYFMLSDSKSNRQLSKMIIL